MSISVTPSAAIASGAPGVRPPVRPGLLIAALLVHAPLGLAMQADPRVATLHAVVTMGVTIWVLIAARSPGPLVWVAAYVVGAEVLWRQTQAMVPWEVAKYVLLVIFTVGIIRFVGQPRRAGATWLFLWALLPACAAPFVKHGILGGFEPLTFNISGLLALGLGVLFISQLTGPWTSMRPALWCLVGPVVAIATLAASGSRALGRGDFTYESNLATSGGYGPNQVSAVLGLGALFLLLLAIKEDGFVRPFLALTLGSWFLLQAALTFSRGGVVNVALAALMAVPFLLRRRDSASRTLMIMLVIGILGTIVVFPRLNEFTGGKLEDRYTKTTEESDLRSEVARQEYQVFVDSLPLGIGVGEAELILINRRSIQAHTEYTRLLAEHGMLGILALVCLVAMIVQAYRRQSIPWGGAWTVTFATWTLVEMSHAASRIAAPAFVFALAMFTFVPEDAEQQP